MPRPCHEDHTPNPAKCKLCWLAENSPANCEDDWLTLEQLRKKRIATKGNIVTNKPHAPKGVPP